MLKPNTYRVLVKPISLDGVTSSGLILGGQQTAGENLLYGRIVDAGDTQFKVGQEVFYSEYSAASVLDARKMIEGKLGYGEAKKNPLVIVAQDDIMAYYEDIRDDKQADL